MCYSLCVLHPECMARRQTKADNISKETLQHCILNWNDLHVYSNQRHNRWRGMNLFFFFFWQLLRFHAAVVFWCLMTTSQEELTRMSVWHMKEFLSAGTNTRKKLKVLSRYAELHTRIMRHNLQEKKALGLCGICGYVFYICTSNHIL